MSADLDVDDVARDVLGSRRYRWLAPDFVRRIAERESRHAGRHTDAVKATKARLHQVYGAYVQDLPAERFVAALEVGGAADSDTLRATCRRLMADHASTRERLPVLDRFYVELFAVTGMPRTLVDLACGLGPLALPWMELPADARYVACDVDRRFVDVATAALTASGVDGRADLRDVVASPPEEVADVALLLKAAPCLEQQAPGSARDVLESVRAHHVAVSFPTRSLGGTGKGMLAHYRQMMARINEGTGWPMQELLFPAELVCIVTKGATTGG